MISVGTVKKFDIRKGYGFITVDNYDKDEIYVHKTGLVDKLRPIRSHDKVSFEIVPASKHDRAINVRLIN